MSKHDSAIRFYFTKLIDYFKSAYFLSGLVLAVFVWIIDPFIDAVFLNKGTVYQLFSQPEPHEIFMRSVLSIVIIRYSYIITTIIDHYRQLMHASEDRYRSFSMSSTNAMLVAVDSDGIVLSWNPAAVRIFGYSEAEILGEQLTCIIPKRFRPSHKEGFQRAVTTNEYRIIGKSVEIMGLKKSGEEFPIELSLGTWNKGRKKYFSAVIHDITERKQAEKELQKLSNAVEHSSSAVIITDIEGNIEYVNSKFIEVTGYHRDEVIGKNPRILKYDKTPDAFFVDMWNTITSGNEWKGEFYNKKKDDSLYWGSATISGVKDLKGDITNYICIQDDVTERKQAEEALRKSETKLASIFNTSPESTVISQQEDGLILLINPAFTKLTKYTTEEVIGKNTHDINLWVNPDDRNTLLKKIESEKSVKDFETEFYNKENIPISVTLSASQIELEGVKCLVSMAHDITERKQAEEQLGYQASHDALTGLINRREFERRAERLLATIKQDKAEHALCYLDLDQFKIVNDTCGHNAGDELLKQLTIVLQHEVSKRDTLSRLGGDEFGVLMEHCPLKHAYRVADSLLKAVQDFQFFWEEHSFKVGVSIGMVVITEAIPNLSELLKHADAACYMAKDLGRNRIHVYQTEDVDLAQRHGEMQWVTRIQRALETDRFCLYAQAIVPLDGSTGKHYELLMRMIDENGTLIPPGAFLAAAERYNMMVEIDRWVIEKAFHSLADNLAFLEQIHFISINLSGQSLTEQNILDLVILQLNESGIESKKICFEITETAAITNMSAAMKFISNLKELGCQFALDDFGSGLSSFGYLKKMTVDYLKIDGMFVKDIVDDPIDYAMVKSINEIGQVMEMQTIAEFVENDEIEGMLRELGVNYAQGYGIEKPMPFDEILDRFNESES